MHVRTILTAGAIGVAGLVSSLALAPSIASAAPATSTTPQTTDGCAYGTWPSWAEGRPASLTAGAAAGLYLWHDSHGWHAFVTHPGHHKVVFEVGVKSSGHIYGVRTHDESGDRVVVSPKDKAVGMRATDYGYLDGMDFLTVCTAHITVAGTIDGHPLTADQVFVGAGGAHPMGVPFTITRQAT